jgi:hypothetical protein
MLPKKGDKVVFNKEFIKDFEGLYGLELRTYKDPIEIIDVTYNSLTDDYSLLLDPNVFQWVQDGTIDLPRNEIIVDKEGKTSYSNNIVFDIVSRIPEFSVIKPTKCYCSDPELITTGFGTLSFQVCKKCGLER